MDEALPHTDGHCDASMRSNYELASDEEEEEEGEDEDDLHTLFTAQTAAPLLVPKCDSTMPEVDAARPTWCLDTLINTAITTVGHLMPFFWIAPQQSFRKTISGSTTGRFRLSTFPGSLTSSKQLQMSFTNACSSAMAWMIWGWWRTIGDPTGGGTAGRALPLVPAGRASPSGRVQLPCGPVQ